MYQKGGKTLAANKQRRSTVVFPADLLDALDEFVSPRQRSRFIVEATEAGLRRARLTRALEQLRVEPAWKDEDHPDLVTDEDVDRYVRQLREGRMPQLPDSAGTPLESS